MTSASERIQWAELDKRKFFMYGPTLFVLVRAAVYPASLVKTRLQVQAGRAHYNGIMDAFSKIVRLEGVRGLYKGFGTNAWTLASGQVYITLLEIIRGQLLPQRMSESARSFIAGGSASLLSQTVMVPLDVVSQRLMMQGQGGVYTAEQPRFRGGLHLATHIVQTQGVRGLYRGYWASVATYAPTSAVWWSMYSAYLDVLPPLLPDSLSGSTRVVLSQALCGMCSGATAAVATNPMDVLRTRLQVQGGHATLRSTLTELVRVEGMRGLFKGAGARVASMAPSSTLTICTYELVKRLSRRTEAAAS